MGSMEGDGETMPGEAGTPPASSRRGVLAALGAALIGAAGGLRGDLLAAAEEAGIVLGPDEAWDVLVEGGAAAEGKRRRDRHARVRFKRRKKNCQAQTGDEFLECAVRCRPTELMMSGGCFYAGLPGEEEVMTLVQHGPLNRQGRYGCQWTSFPGGGILAPTTYQAVVVCRSPKRG